MAITSTENMEKSFGELKVSLNDQRTKENCNRLCDLFSFPPRVRDSILRSESSGSQLLEHCIERKIIEPGNVTRLWEALTKAKLVSVATLVHEYVQSHAQEVEDIKEGAVIPSDNESDDVSGCSDTQYVTFEEFLHVIGLKEVFPQHFELESFVKIKDVRLERDETSIAKKFWQTLSSLDYRVRSSHFLRSIGDSGCLAKFSIRDFIFAVLHCSESFLRQDILEKLSSCHLAVPIILQGVNGSQPEFLLWSLRRIFKKWRESESTALEQQIIQVPVFTVSFMRIGDINEVSKSSILNRLLGDCQGIQLGNHLF